MKVSHLFHDFHQGKQVSYEKHPDQAVIRLTNTHGYTKGSHETGTLAAQAVANQLADDGLPLIQHNAINLEEGTALVRLTADANTQADNLGSELVRAWFPVLIDETGTNRYFLPDEALFLDTDDAHHSSLTQIARKMLIDVEGFLETETKHEIGAHTYRRTQHPNLLEKLASDTFRSDYETHADQATIPIWHRIEVGIELLEDVIRCLMTRTPPNEHLQWGMQNNGQEVEGVAGTPGADSSAWKAQRYIEDNNLKGDYDKVVVAVIDTGVDEAHPNLVANILPRHGEDWNFATRFNNKPVDNLGHGTHCAGIAAAAFIGQDAVRGAAPKVKIMPIKIDLVFAEYHKRAEAITYVANYAQKHKDKRFIISCSWKTGTKDIHAIRQACEYASSQDNVLVCFSAGNGDRDLDKVTQYPAAYPFVFTVAATESHDQKSKISNWGAVVDICSPGQAIYSTFPQKIKSEIPYCFLDGTSMATPLVAGGCALIWAHDMGLSPAKLRKIVTDSGNNINSILKPQYKGKMGPRVNLLNAIRAVVGDPA